MSKTTYIVLSIILATLIFGGGVFMWNNTRMNTQEPTVPAGPVGQFQNPLSPQLSLSIASATGNIDDAISAILEDNNADYATSAEDGPSLLLENEEAIGSLGQSFDTTQL